MYLIDKDKITEEIYRDVGKFLGTCSFLKIKMDEIETKLREIRQKWEDREALEGPKVTLKDDPKKLERTLLEIEALAGQLSSEHGSKTKPIIKAVRKL